MTDLPLPRGVANQNEVNEAQHQSCPSEASSMSQANAPVSNPKNGANKSLQLRVRLHGEQAKRWATIPPRTRAKALSLLMGTWEQQCSLDRILALQENLVRIMFLLNQTIKCSHEFSHPVDTNRVMKAVEFLEKLSGVEK